MIRIKEMTKNFELSSYLYDLPKELIADRPTLNRDHCRLMIYDESSDEIHHRYFYEIKDFLKKKDTLVLNNSKVIPCRLEAKKLSGGKAEIFFLNIDQASSGLYTCLIKSNSKKRLGDLFNLPGDKSLKIVSKDEKGNFLVELDADIETYLNQYGKMPIPHYIRSGKSDEKDSIDYQNIFASKPGSVAAPTAGLHFTKELLAHFNHAYITLHVGLGTFKPVVTKNILEHQMHSESFYVERPQVEKIESAKNIIGVGTTSLRVLESCYDRDHFNFPDKFDSTDIFLHPGVDVRSIQGLITNFHLPGSSLIMLVSSLIGIKKTMMLYNIAIEKKYRFYSYGDAMLILRKNYV